MYNLGIDVGGTNIAVGIVDDNYKIIKRASVKTLVPRKKELICNDIVTLCLNILKDCSLNINQINSIGIGVPGAVDQNSKTVEFCANLFLRNWDISKYIQKKLNKPVYVENDANVAAIAEHKIGVAKGYKDVVCITIGTGIGSGIIIDNKLFRGVNFNAGEIGHMVICNDKRECTCKRKGCFEQYASTNALVRLTKEMLLANDEKHNSKIWELINNNVNNISGRTAFRAYDEKDKLAENILTKYFDYLSCGITNIVNILQPQIICIGGGISNEKEKLLSPVKERVYSNCYSKYSKIQTKIEIASLGNDAGIIGAAMLYEENK